VIPTDHGDFTLFREPGARPGFVAVAEAWERWQFVLGDDVVLEVEDAAAPWLPVAGRLRQGVHGTLDGVPFTTRPARRSVLPRRRGLHADLDDGRTLSLVVERSRRTFVRTVDGEVRLTLPSKGERWETGLLDRGEAALLCFVLVSGAGSFLVSPLWDVF
jgi:hypothetical protein